MLPADGRRHPPPIVTRAVSSAPARNRVPEGTSKSPSTDNLNCHFPYPGASSSSSLFTNTSFNEDTVRIGFSIDIPATTTSGSLVSNFATPSPRNHPHHEPIPGTSPRRGQPRLRSGALGGLPPSTREETRLTAEKSAPSTP